MGQWFVSTVLCGVCFRLVFVGVFPAKLFFLFVYLSYSFCLTVLRGGGLSFEGGNGIHVIDGSAGLEGFQTLFLCAQGEIKPALGDVAVAPKFFCVRAYLFVYYCCEQHVQDFRLSLEESMLVEVRIILYGQSEALGELGYCGRRREGREGVLFVCVCIVCCHIQNIGIYSVYVNVFFKQ